MYIDVPSLETIPPYDSIYIVLTCNDYLTMVDEYKAAEVDEVACHHYI